MYGSSLSLLCCNSIIARTYHKCFFILLICKIIQVFLHYYSSIKEISKLCNFSEYYFMRFFKKYSGTSCLKYINNYRLEKAAELLKSTAYSITDISLKCGFNNLSYFNKLFKRKYHLTPREFRDNI